MRSGLCPSFGEKARNTRKTNKKALAIAAEAAHAADGAAHRRKAFSQKAGP